MYNIVQHRDLKHHSSIYYHHCCYSPLASGGESEFLVVGAPADRYSTLASSIPNAPLSQQTGRGASVVRPRMLYYYYHLPISYLRASELAWHDFGTVVKRSPKSLHFWFAMSYILYIKRYILTLRLSLTLDFVTYFWLGKQLVNIWFIRDKECVSCTVNSRYCDMLGVRN